MWNSFIYQFTTVLKYYLLNVLHLSLINYKNIPSDLVKLVAGCAYWHKDVHNFTYEVCCGINWLYFHSWLS